LGVDFLSIFCMERAPLVLVAFLKSTAPPTPITVAGPAIWNLGEGF